LKVFTVDPADFRDTFNAQGWVHISNGVHPEFLQTLRDFAAHSLKATQLEGFAIKGKKEQSLFDFPSAVDYPGELFDFVSALCGLRRPSVTLSERHIQAYEPNAEPEPLAHKDRFASQISLGFSIDIPADSRLVLYPHDHRGLNPYNASATYVASLQPDEHPSLLRQHARELVIDDQPGDLVAFHGSTTWHLRRNSAGAVNLYCKFNDFDADPLGEDPTTAERRSKTLSRLNGADTTPDDLVPVLGRQLDLVSRHYTRTWDQALQANVYGEPGFGITATQLEILRAVDGTRGVSEIRSHIETGPDGFDSGIRVLAERGALDLLMREEASARYGAAVAAPAAA
jgi:hypothetical protein